MSASRRRAAGPGRLRARLTTRVPRRGLIVLMVPCIVGASPAGDQAIVRALEGADRLQGKLPQAMRLFVAEVQRQTDVVFGDRARARLAVDQVVEFGFLELLRDLAFAREAGHQLGEPPREALGAPDAAQAALGVAVDAGFGVFLVVLDDGCGQ